jgi:hypothetical protein
MIKFVPLQIKYDLPQFDPSRIAKDDEESSWEIQGNLHSITRYGEDFGAAVQLFDFAIAQGNELKKLMPPPPNREGLSIDEQMALSNQRQLLRNELQPQEQIYNRWKFIAARDGAITIYNLGMSMQGIRASLKDCPSLNASVDQATLSASTRLLRQRFRRFEGFRHMVAHAAEFSQTKDARAEHSTTAAMDNGLIKKPEGGDIFIGPSLNGREFIGTFEGKVLSYEISLESFEHIKKAALMFICAFRPAVNPFFLKSQELYEQMKRN